MKNFKRIASLLLAMTMILCMAMPIFADDEDASATTKYTYEIYQIFTGTYDKDSQVLSDLKWGQNGTGTIGELVDKDVRDALEAVNVEGATNAQKLEVITKYFNAETKAIKTVNTNDNPYTVNDLADGYYLVKDKDNTQDGEGESYTTYIVMVVNGTLTINRKADSIVPNKTITSDDYNDNNGADDSVAADGITSNGAVGSKVDFTLTAKIPANANDYSYYYCVFNDTLSDGLTFDPNSVKVTVKDTDGSETTLVAGTDYSLYTEADAEGHTFQIAMRHAKDYAGKTITVTYSATINENAVIGVEGNPNKFDVTYSNNPNFKYDDENGNGKPDETLPDSDEKVPTGETPEKETRTYVTGVKLIKVDENGNVLTGAEFEITGASVKYVLVSEETFEVAEDGEYWKLNNDTYTKEAPITANTMIAQEDRTQGGYVATEDGREGTIEVGGTKYAPATKEELENTDITIYKLLKANSDLYDSTETKYAKTVTYTVKGDEEKEEIKAFVGADGVLYFTGLGEGVYTIKETTTPDGYNTIPDITLTIDWTAPEKYEPGTEGGTDCTWSATANTVDGNLTLNDEGVFELTIVNVKGSNLPSTGGIGTTIFYIVGGVLLAGAVVLLITKRRMSIDE